MTDQDIKYIQNQSHIKTPKLGHFLKKKSVEHILRLEKEQLVQFFNKKNLATPDNDGETRISLEMLKECGYNDGFCQLLATDPETGLVGDELDITRRQAVYGKHEIAMPKIEGFIKLTAR